MTPRLVLRRRPAAAFESLYQRHVYDVYRYALALLGSHADAEDVTQTTFLNAFRAFQRGERPRKPGNWLRAIAHNVCRQRMRQAARRPRELPLWDEVGANSPVDESEHPSAEDIARALCNLTFNQRAALVMRDMEGRRPAEIADALGISVSAVETLLFRGRRALREQLESSMTCGEAARAISRQLDGAAPRAERTALRAHLRACHDCASFARAARAQRGALRRLGGVSLPASLLSWAGATCTTGGAGAVTAAATAPAAGLGLKLTAGVAAMFLVAGTTDIAVRTVERPASHPQHVSAITRPDVERRSRERADAVTAAVRLTSEPVGPSVTPPSAPDDVLMGDPKPEKRGARAAKPPKPDKRAKPDKPDRPDKPDKPDKPAKPDKPDKLHKRAKADKPEMRGKPDKPDMTSAREDPRASKPVRNQARTAAKLPKPLKAYDAKKPVDVAAS